MKIKIFRKPGWWQDNNIEDEINEFIKDVEVIDIKISSSGTRSSPDEIYLVMYNKKKDKVDLI